MLRYSLNPSQKMKKKKGIKEREKEKEKEKSYRWKNRWIARGIRRRRRREGGGGGACCDGVVCGAVEQLEGVACAHETTEKGDERKEKERGQRGGTNILNCKGNEKKYKRKRKNRTPTLSLDIILYNLYNTRIIFKKTQLQQHRSISTLPEMIVSFSF